MPPVRFVRPSLLSASMRALQAARQFIQAAELLGHAGERFGAVVLDCKYGADFERT